MKWLFLTSLLLSLSNCAQSQSRGDIRIMFYNAENLFDTEDNPKAEDDEFTPSGSRHWNTAKYTRKLQNIYKVIAGVGGWQAPEIIGMAEIENRKVLTDLLQLTPLKKLNYRIVHFDSPDPRGIDVALLYNPLKLKLILERPLRVHFPGEPDITTRDILFARFISSDDTLNIFVNHWPSRRSGESETEKHRIRAAIILRNTIDSVFSANIRSKIVIMGDFNDEASNVSISKYLKADLKNIPHTKGLLNLSAQLNNPPVGTHNFRGHWSILDQIIVSYGLLISETGLYTTSTSFQIFSAEYLLQSDARNLTKKPFPAYTGPRYLGGFSDHLPVYVDLFLKH